MRKKMLTVVIFLCMVGQGFGGTHLQRANKSWKVRNKGTLLQVAEQTMSREDCGKFLTKSQIKCLNRFEKTGDLSRFNINKSQIRFSKRIDNSLYIEAMIEIFEDWDGSSWCNRVRRTIRYDEDGNTLEIREESWDSGSSVYNKLTRAVYFNNSHGLPVFVLHQTGNATGAIWIDRTRETYTYDSNFFLVEELVEDNAGWTWVPAERTVYTNNPNGDPILVVDLIWDGAAWQNEYQESYTWTDTLLTQEIGQLWDGTTWINGHKDEYTYDEFGNENTDNWQTWNGSTWENCQRWEGDFFALSVPNSEIDQWWNGSTWINGFQIVYSYNASWHQTKELHRTWNGTGWENNWQNQYYYDGSWNVIRLLTVNWSGSAWENDNQILSTFDANNNPVDDLGQWWNGTSWLNDYRHLYTFQESTGVADGQGTVPETYAISNYPNPFNPSTTILFSLPQGSKVTLGAYNINGRLVDRFLEGIYYEAGIHAVAWNGMDESGKPMPSGVYLVRMETGTTVKVHRCMLIK